MYHILVVDDESRIRTLIRKYAVFDGYDGGGGRRTGCRPSNMCRARAAMT